MTAQLVSLQGSVDLLRSDPKATSAATIRRSLLKAETVGAETMQQHRYSAWAYCRAVFALHLDDADAQVTLRNAVEADILRLKKDQMPEAELRAEIINHPPANTNQLSTKYLVDMLGLEDALEDGSFTQRGQHIKPEVVTATIAKAEARQRKMFTKLSTERDLRSVKFDTPRHTVSKRMAEKDHVLDGFTFAFHVAMARDHFRDKYGGGDNMGKGSAWALLVKKVDKAYWTSAANQVEFEDEVFDIIAKALYGDDFNTADPASYTEGRTLEIARLMLLTNAVFKKVRTSRMQALIGFFSGILIAILAVTGILGLMGEAASTQDQTAGIMMIGGPTRKSLALSPPPSPPPSPPGTDLAKLKEMKALLDAGILTQEEFEVQKREILGTGSVPAAPTPAQTGFIEMSITVPPGGGPGATLAVPGPDGQKYNVTVPDGVQVGQAFTVKLPVPGTTSTPEAPQTPPAEEVAKAAKEKAEAEAKAKVEAIANAEAEAKVKAEAEAKAKAEAEATAKVEAEAVVKADAERAALEAKTKAEKSVPAAPTPAQTGFIEMSITVPPGGGPGATLAVPGPDGQKYNVTVPDGVQVGQAFTVKLPVPDATPKPEAPQAPPAEEAAKAAREKAEAEASAGTASGGGALTIAQRIGIAIMEKEKELGRALDTDEKMAVAAKVKAAEAETVARPAATPPPPSAGFVLDLPGDDDEPALPPAMPLVPVFKAKALTAEEAAAKETQKALEHEVQKRVAQKITLEVEAANEAFQRQMTDAMTIRYALFNGVVFNFIIPCLLLAPLILVSTLAAYYTCACTPRSLGWDPRAIPVPTPCNP